MPAVPGDALALSRLIRRTVRSSNAGDYNQAEIELVCRAFAPERIVEAMTRRTVFLARRGGRPVGTVTLGEGKLHALFVDPALQGCGLGRRLVEHVEASARERGLERLELSSSITARVFYERLGYRLIAFGPRAEGATYLMEKDL